jgi:hypothetical protein
MSFILGMGTEGSVPSQDANFIKIQLLQALKDLNTAILAGGATETSLQSLITIASAIETLATNLDTTTTQASWASIVGNSIELTYNTDGNLETVLYKTGATTVFTQTLSYNVDGNLESIVTS